MGVGEVHPAEAESLSLLFELPGDVVPVAFDTAWNEDKSGADFRIVELA